MMARDEAALSREARRLGRRLLGREPEGDVIDAYVRWHRRSGEEEAPRDRFLLAVARAPCGFSLAEAFCARFSRASFLRRKLVLLLALVEAGPEGEVLDRPVSRHPREFWPRMALRGAQEALSLLAALLLVAPVALLLSRRTR